MKLITLWSIIIKIIGVVFAFTFVQSTIVMLLGGIPGVLSAILLVLIQGLIAYMCLFRTKEIIQIFKLESTIEEKEVSVSLNESNVMRLSIAIIGIYSLSQSIPELFVGTLGMLFIVVIKITIGLLMVLKAKEIEQRISNYRSK